MLYAREREAFGKPIADFQAVQIRLADMATSIQAARLLVQWAASQADAGKRVDMQAGMAKLFASEVAVKSSLEAMRIHGGYGYSQEFVVERLYRDAPLMVIGEGTSDVMQMVIARALVSGLGGHRMTARSHLYVPGDRADVLAKALDRGADALIVDLEDAVPAGDQGRGTRHACAGWLATVPRRSDRDLGAGQRRRARVCGMSGRSRPRRGSRGSASPRRSPLPTSRRSAPCSTSSARRRRWRRCVESAAALLRAESIAAAPRVRRLQVGEADLRADTGILPGPDERELGWVRSWVVLVSAAAGIEPPVGPVSTDFRDLDALRESTEALRRMGYRGRACIHPAQVEVVNAVFTPSDAELEAARRVVASYDAALAGGSGVVIGDDGRMIDEAVVRQARRLLS